MLTTVLIGFDLNSLYNLDLGVHVANITDLTVIVAVTKDLFIGGITYTIGTALIKLSFGLTLQRFTQERWHKILVYCTLFAVVAVSIGSVGFKLGICR